MSLEDTRKEIDEVDREIISLIAKRIQLAQKAGQEKANSDIPMIAPEREEAVIQNVKQVAHSLGLDEAAIESLYHKIIVISRVAQETRVAFQGEPGAYSEEAAISFFGSGISTVPCSSLRNTFASLSAGQVQYAVIPIENSLQGGVAESYDLLLDSDFKVCGEIELRVSHCLIGDPQADLGSIKAVYSHPQALGQCQAFLGHLECELFPAYDTAGSVKIIKEKRDLTCAAVASARAAQIYGMKILAHAIEDNPHNYTRFFVLARQDTEPSGHDKTSIALALKHRPGALHSFLSHFSQAGINLTKIESRPTRQKPWEYNFYIDLQGHRKDRRLADTLAQAEEDALFIKILGSYPEATKG